jgi:microcystin-dependent protein
MTTFENIGVVALFAGPSAKAPNGWSFCDGQELQISANSALYAIIGNAFGGNGKTTFGLPKPAPIGKCRYMIHTDGRYFPFRVMGDMPPFAEVDSGGEGSIIGAVVPMQGDSVPQGWLPCDGRELKGQDYRELLAVIRYTYGGVNDKFNLPNLNSLGQEKYMVCYSGLFPDVA